ncbi:MAG TPA: hypothetical protein VMM78_12240 [Thermomicrobiales bacterium]|nr:hypothetical protein [Thermomicrobiales bacterium]
MRRMVVTLALVAGLFVAGTMSGSAAGADPQSVVAGVPGHELQHEDDAIAAADGVCTAWYAIQGDRVLPR